jgi:lipoic acid synthetase
MTAPVSVPLIRGRRPQAVPPQRDRKPGWLRVRAPGSPEYLRLKRLMRDLNLRTVCEEAMCPNIGECWHHGTATFMILGDICTRSCGYCNVIHGRPESTDSDEPQRVAHAVGQLELQHVVVTSVDRDDLADGGASVFAQTIHAIRKIRARCRVEVLIPDFSGRREHLDVVLNARPSILNHNIETVERLYRVARPGGQYRRALELLTRAAASNPRVPTKSGLMLGLGESLSEVETTLRDLRSAGCGIVTIGQYLRPSAANLPVSRYYTPGEFDELGRVATALGFGHVESGPLVRSSYHAHEQSESFDHRPRL